MNRLRPWCVVLLLGLFAFQPLAVYAQSSPKHAVVLLAGSNLPASEKSALMVLIESLSNALTAEDRIGVILYSDIVEHVSALAPPSSDESQRIERVLDSLPAIDAFNGAVGIDRALELLSESSLQSSVIIVGELDVRLEDAVLKGRYSRWLDGTLLPTAASERIGLMVISDQARHEGLLQRYGNDTFAQIAAAELDAETLSAMALKHVQTRVSVPVVEPVAEVPTPDLQSTTASESSVTTLSTAATNDSVVDTTATTEAIADSTEPSSNPSGETVVNTVADVNADVVSVAVPNQTAQNASSSPGDRFASLSMAPLFILGAIILGLVGAGVFYLAGRRKRRPSRASQTRRQAQTQDFQTELPPTQPFSTALRPTSVAADATVQNTRSNRDDDESRFAELIDSISGAEQETLPLRSRDTQEFEDATVETRTVDASRKRSTSTADLTRELEDLTRARNRQYDFE